MYQDLLDQSEQEVCCTAQEGNQTRLWTSSNDYLKIQNSQQFHGYGDTCVELTFGLTVYIPTEFSIFITQCN
jgi:hypothetical protein